MKQVQSYANFVLGSWFYFSSLYLSLVSLSLSTLISKMKKQCDFEMTWVFYLAQFYCVKLTRTTWTYPKILKPRP